MCAMQNIKAFRIKETTVFRKYASLINYYDP